VLFLAALITVFACGGAPRDEDSPGRFFTQAGKLQNVDIREASGLARSHRNDKILWAINDSGATPTLYALGADGSDLGSVLLRDATNVDWEDLASFESGGKSWLLVADIGDNDSNRDHVTLYFVEEPVLPQVDLAPAWQLSFAYPDGPRDAEAIAVDLEHQQILILSKRTIPAVLYAVPLRPHTGELTIARRLGEISSIPQPTREDLDRAIPDNDWHWQPTGMDISQDGRSAVILSYRAIYTFKRDAGESWIEAMQSTPLRLPLSEIRGAEAVAFDASGQAIFVTVEQKHAPLLRFDRQR